MTANGIAYWVGGINDTMTGMTEGAGLFYNDAGVETNILKSGDVIGTLAPLEGNGIDFDVRFAAQRRGVDRWPRHFGSRGVRLRLRDGRHWRWNDHADHGGRWPVEGSRADDRRPRRHGRRELDNFDFFGITDSGSWMVTGDTDGATGPTSSWPSMA